MKKELNAKQLLVFGFVSLLLSKLPLGQVVGVALEFGGNIAILAGIVMGITSFFKRRKRGSFSKEQVEEKTR